MKSQVVVEYIDLKEDTEHLQDNQAHPKITTLIPRKKLAQWNTRAKRGAFDKLQNLLEFRELPLEEYRRQGLLTQAELEGAEAMLVTLDSLRRSLWQIQEFDGAQLLTWITNGVSFQHFERANAIAEKAKMTPAQLLDDAYVKGNQFGKTMTVEQMTAYALGERKQPEAAYSISRMFSTIIVKVSQSLKWDAEKLSEFKADVNALQRKWFG